MSHVPFGYCIKDGKPCVNEKQTIQIHTIYNKYLSGMSMDAAANSAGLHLSHSVVKRILTNEHYLGDAYYPAIIDKQLFNAAAAELQKRAKSLNRKHKVKNIIVPEIPTEFQWKQGFDYFDDPYIQAQYLYSLIESE